MKRLLLILLCVPLLFSCGEENKDATQFNYNSLAKDINVSEINDECELLDAYLIVFDEMIELYEVFYSLKTEKEIMEYWNNMTTDEQKRLKEKKEMLDRKFKEIQDKFRKFPSRNDKEKAVGHCNNFKEFIKSEKKFRKLIGIDVFMEEIDPDISWTTLEEEIDIRRPEPPPPPSTKEEPPPPPEVPEEIEIRE